MNAATPTPRGSPAHAPGADDAADDAPRDPALALLRALAAEDGQSLPRVAKRLGLAGSELRRLVVALGDDPRFGGLGVVEARGDDRGRERLWLTARGRMLRDGAPDDGVRHHGVRDRGMHDDVRDHGMPARVARDGDDAPAGGPHSNATPRGDDGLRAVEALRLDGDGAQTREDWVVEETPVAFLYNGMSFAVMMATPTDVEDFAWGFALCEGIVAAAEELRLVDVVRHARGVALHAAIPQARFDALEARRRTLEGRSGCGLCGVSDLDAALRPVRRVAAGPRLPAQAIHDGLTRLARSQPLNARCGGAHAAAFIAGETLLVREDVGRHNAVDKVVGALLRDAAAPDAASGFLGVTSRASYEIVHKAAHAGIGVVAAMSAPTALAIRHAEEAGITLIAFARDGRMNVYSGHARIA